MTDMSRRRFLTMANIAINRSSVKTIIERLEGKRSRGLRLQLRLMRSGLEASAVHRVTADFYDHRDRRRMVRMIAKRLPASSAREAAIYRQLVAAILITKPPRASWLRVAGRSRQRLSPLASNTAPATFFRWMMRVCDSSHSTTARADATCADLLWY